MSESYFPFYLNWVELMETKDTDAKQLAFIRGIVDAYRGVEPPRPSDLEAPHGTDYARRDGYLVAKPILSPDRRKRGGQPGNQNARKTNEGEEEKRIENESKTNQENESKRIFINNKKEKEKEYKNIPTPSPVCGGELLDCEDGKPKVTRKTVLSWFDGFWSSYPSECPRKANKVKCREKWLAIFQSADDKDALHGRILAALECWKRCELWTKDGGQFIKAPLVWLNNSNWEDAPKQARQAEEDEAAAARRRYREEEERQKAILRAKGALP